MGFNLIGKVTDVFPNYLLSKSRSGIFSERNRDETEAAEKRLDYYLTHQAWKPDLGIDLDGLKAVIAVYAEQADMKGSIPSTESTSI